MRRSAVVALAATALALAFAADATAQTFTGTTIGASTWHRPNTGEPPTSLANFAVAVPFNVFGFNASATGAYTILSSGFDTFLCLYQDAFSTASPLSNVLACNDDYTTGGASRLIRELNAGVDYFAVITGFSNGTTGAYTLTFTGAGTVSPIGSTPPPEPPPAVAVPEPHTFALLAVGLVMLIPATRARRSVRT